MSDQSNFPMPCRPLMTSSSTDYSPPPGSSRLGDSTNASPRPYFMSLDLSTEKLGLVIVDEQLDVLLADEVKFDSDLPEYGTQYGCHTDGEVSTSPTHMHVKALDLLLRKVSNKVELQRVKCISGSAQQHASVWWSKAASTLLSRLTPQKTLHEQLPPEQTWTMPNPPNFYDMSTAAQAQSLEWMIGGSEEMARRTGGRAFCRFTGVQIMKVHQNQRNILEATDRISLASSFLASLFLGSIAPLSEGDAASMGLWNMSERTWDPLVLNLIMSSDSTQSEPIDESTKLMKKLGDPHLDCALPLGPIASYFVRRYGFSPECQIAGFVGHHLSTFMSYRLGPQDVLVCLGDTDSDSVVVPIAGYLPDSARQVLPHPARAPPETTSEASGVALLEYKDADLARCFVRDTYCNASWHTFDTLVTLIPEGGTIGLDDKLFTFFWPHGELGNWQGIYKFEGGQRVEEYKDRRANPRSLLESQFLKMRIQLARINQELKQLKNPENSLPAAYSLLGFNPYDHSVLPKRIIVTGRASDSRVMVDLLSSIIGAPAYQSASLAPSTYSPFFSGPEGAVTAAGLGACYKAVWTYIRQRNNTESYSAFLADRFQLRSNRLRGATFDGRRSSIPIITTSIASFEAPEASIQSCPHLTPRRMSFSTVKTAPGLWNDGRTSPEPQNSGSILVIPIQTDPDDAEAGLIKVADPNEDLFQRYGGQVEEYARLESYVLRGIL